MGGGGGAGGNSDNGLRLAFADEIPVVGGVCGGGEGGRGERNVRMRESMTVAEPKRDWSQ